ncbi:PE-PPE domain-containing protein [Mycobacterium sp. NPDC003323]
MTPALRMGRRLLTTVLTVATALLITVATTLSMAVALAATALIVPGTGTPNANIVGNYLENARDYYIAPFNPACTAANDCALQGIDYPAQFWPIPLPGWGGLSGAKWDVSTGEGLANLNSTLVDTLAQNPPNTPVVLMGYSQGGNIVSRQKRNLGYLPKDQTYLSFVMIGNSNRPNGGLFERLAFLGHVPILDATFGLPAPTDTCDHICATDIAFEYDGVADFPLYPINGLAVLNAIAGFWYVHGTYLAPNANSDVGELPDDYTPEELAAEVADPDNWQEHGDTRYVTIPTRTLPIVRPFLEFASFTNTEFLIKPIVALVSPLLRVIIDAGYDRSLSYGTPAPFRLIPRINPITFAKDVVEAIDEGIHAALGRNPAPQQVTPKPAPRVEAATAQSPARDEPRAHLTGLRGPTGAEVLEAARDRDTASTGHDDERTEDDEAALDDVVTDEGSGSTDDFGTEGAGAEDAEDFGTDDAGETNTTDDDAETDPPASTDAEAA